VTASFLPGAGIPQPYSPGTGGSGPGRNGAASRDSGSGGHHSGGGTFGSPRFSVSTPVSADAAERDMERRAAEANKAIQATGTGQTLWDVLDMPEDFGRGDQEFLMSIDRTIPVTDFYGNPAQGTEVVNYTVAAGVEWLRNLAVNNTRAYDSLVADLYQAGYLSEGDVRFGAFTGKVAQGFAEAAFDTARVNMGRDPGSIITLFDSLDSIITGFEESGFGPNGPGGGGGREEPIRQDQWYDKDTLRETIRGAAQNALGRSLTDAEEAAFISSFHGKEQSWNDSNWQATQAAAAGGTASVTDRPSDTDAATLFVRENPALAQEKAGEDMASYVGVMSRMMGLGGEGIGLATG
jgi:hypothetical protein